MKKLRLLGLTLLVMFALGAVGAGSAFALPELLPQRANTSFTGESDQARGTLLELVTTGGSTVTCTSAKATGVQETDTLGLFHIDFEGCKSSGVSCNTSGDRAGVILSLGKFHYVFDALGTGESLGVAVLFLLPETEKTTFECFFVGVEVKGELLCLILKPLESARDHLFHCVQTRGVQDHTVYWNDEGREVRNAFLLTKIGNGAFEQSGELALALVLFPEAVAFMNH